MEHVKTLFTDCGNGACEITIFCTFMFRKQFNIIVHFITSFYYEEERLWAISFGDKENNPNSHVFPIATNSKLGIQTLKR